MLAACQELHYICVYCAYHLSTALATSFHPASDSRKQKDSMNAKKLLRKINNDIFQLVKQSKSFSNLLSPRFNFRETKRGGERIISQLRNEYFHVVDFL